MNNQEVKSRLMDWLESLLLENWIRGHMLDMLSPSEWREIAEREAILHAPLLRSLLVEVRSEILEDPSVISGPRDWQEISESRIRSLEKPKWEG